MAATPLEQRAEQLPEPDSKELRRQKAREYSRQYCATHREQIADYKRETYDPAKRREKYLRNQEHNLETARRWREEDPGLPATLPRKKKAAEVAEVAEAYAEDGREMPPAA